MTYKTHRLLRVSFAPALILLVFLLQNCAQRTDKSAPQRKPLEKVKIRYAEGFTINRYESYTRINVFNAFQDQPDTLRYNLVSRDQKVPEKLPDGQLIRTPIQSMIASSTTHIALTDMLNANEVISGMVGAQYVFNPRIKAGVKQGKITAFNQGEFNNEVALNMQPDMIMISAGQSSQYDKYSLLVDSGIPVFVNAEWLERTPLGKAEWLKVMGALLEKEDLAQQKFANVARRYKQLKAKADSVKSKPLVINNMPYKGAWFVSGGNSFTARYLKDAGADYPWYENESTGGLRLDFETVYAAGLRADVWLNPGSATTEEDILAKDMRFSDLKPLKNGRIYNNTKRMNTSGGNDFWETGVVRPDLILSDLITILHADSVMSDSLYFYQKVQ